MVLLKSFCCVYPLRTGTMFAGFYSMTAAALFVGLLLIRYLGFEEETKEFVNHKIVYVTMALYVLYIITCAVLPLGVHRRVTWLIILWALSAIIVVICYGSGIMCWILMDQHDKLGKVEPWELGITFIHAVNIIVTVYMLLCVFSHLQSIFEKKDRRRRRHDSRHVLFLPGAGGGVIAVDARDTELYLQERGLQPQVEVGPVSPPAYTSELPPAYSTLPRRDEETAATPSRPTRQDSTSALVENEVMQTPNEAGVAGVHTGAQISAGAEHSLDTVDGILNHGASLDSIHEEMEDEEDLDPSPNLTGQFAHEPRVADEDIPYVLHSLSLDSHSMPIGPPLQPHVIIARPVQPSSHNRSSRSRRHRHRSRPSRRSRHGSGPQGIGPPSPGIMHTPGMTHTPGLIRPPVGPMPIPAMFHGVPSAHGGEAPPDYETAINEGNRGGNASPTRQVSGQRREEGGQAEGPRGAEGRDRSSENSDTRI